MLAGHYQFCFMAHTEFERPQLAARNGKLDRMARTKPASTLVEITSRGEKSQLNMCHSAAGPHPDGEQN